MNNAVKFTLSYKGNDSDKHLIDLYDVSQALIGFQRSLALTAHLVINGKIITQAPFLKGARILTAPAKAGSWEMVATIIAGAYALGTAPKDTPLGHLIYSVYDYIVHESLGFHVDYDKTIGELVEEHNQKGAEEPISLEQYQVDSLLEKCNTAMKEIHRPIFKTQSAREAKIIAEVNLKRLPVGRTFNLETYDYIHEEFADEDTTIIEGRVSSYNSNTFKGRIYVAREGRPVTFILSDTCKDNSSLGLLTASLTAYTLKDFTSEWITVYCRVYRNTSRSGQLKSYKVLEVAHGTLQA